MYLYVSEIVSCHVVCPYDGDQHLRHARLTGCKRNATLTPTDIAQDLVQISV